MYGSDSYNCNSLSLYVSFPTYQILILRNLSSDVGRTNEPTLRFCTFPRSLCGPISDSEIKLRDSRNSRQAHTEEKLQPNS
jgi:hypothetical protein